MTKNKVDRSEWLIQKADFYKVLKEDDSNLLAYEFIQKYTNDNQTLNREQSKNLISEANQFERQYSSFLSVAVSFIVAGLLSARPDIMSTQATKVFYMAALVFALMSATFLLIESIAIQRYYTKWLAAVEGIGNYISNGNWKNSTELTKYVDEHQIDLPKNSTKWLSYTMLSLTSIAILFMILWQIENLFNPDWKFIDPVSWLNYNPIHK